MRMRAFLLAAALCATPAATAAGEAKQAPALHMRTDCTAGESVPLDFDRFVADPDSQIGRCVHLRGLIVDSSLYRDPMQFYESSKEGRRSGIILYGSDQSDRDDRTLADVVGFTMNCDYLWGWAEAEADAANKEAGTVTTLAFVGGRCHSFIGTPPVLYVSHWTPVEGDTRLHGHGTYRYSDLTETSDVWDHHDEVSGIVRSVLDAIRRGDAKQLAKVMSANGLMEGDANEDAAEMTDPAKSRAAFLIGRPDAPSIIYFRGRRRADDPPRAYSAYGCVCKVSDCEGEWPIAEIDTGTNKAWPYFCVGVGWDGSGKSKPYLLDEPRYRE